MPDHEYLDLLRDIRKLEQAIVEKLGAVSAELPLSTSKVHAVFQDEYARCKTLQAQAAAYRSIQQRAYLMQRVLEGTDSPASAWSRGLGAHLEVNNTIIAVTLSGNARVFETGPTTVTVLLPKQSDTIVFMPPREARPFSDLVAVNEWTGQSIHVRPSDVDQIALELTSKKTGFLWFSKVTVGFLRLKCSFPGRDGFRTHGLRGDGTAWTAVIRLLSSADFWPIVDGLMYRLDCGVAIGGELIRKPLQLE